MGIGLLQLRSLVWSGWPNAQHNVFDGCNNGQRSGVHVSITDTGPELCPSLLWTCWLQLWSLTCPGCPTIEAMSIIVTGTIMDMHGYSFGHSLSRRSKLETLSITVVAPIMVIAACNTVTYVHNCIPWCPAIETTALFLTSLLCP